MGGWAFTIDPGDGSVLMREQYFPVGMVVEVKSLVNSAALNGTRGRVTGRRGNRVLVLLVNPHGEQSLKPTNLRVVRESPTATCSDAVVTVAPQQQSFHLTKGDAEDKEATNCPDLDHISVRPLVHFDCATDDKNEAAEGSCTSAGGACAPTANTSVSGESSSSLKLGNCLVVSRNYDGSEVVVVNDVNHMQLGYLSVRAGEVVRILSGVEFGHSSNQFARYVYAQPCAQHEVTAGWLPIDVLGSRMELF